VPDFFFVVPEGFFSGMGRGILPRVVLSAKLLPAGSLQSAVAPLHAVHTHFPTSFIFRHPAKEFLITAAKEFPITGNPTWGDIFEWFSNLKSPNSNASFH